MQTEGMAFYNPALTFAHSGLGTVANTIPTPPPSAIACDGPAAQAWQQALAKKGVDALALTLGVGFAGTLVGIIAGALLWDEHRVGGGLLGGMVLGTMASAIAGALANWPTDDDVPAPCRTAQDTRTAFDIVQEKKDCLTNCTPNSWVESAQACRCVGKNQAAVDCPPGQIWGTNPPGCFHPQSDGMPDSGPTPPGGYGF